MRPELGPVECLTQIQTTVTDDDALQGLKKVSETKREGSDSVRGVMFPEDKIIMNETNKPYSLSGAQPFR